MRGVTVRRQLVLDGRHTGHGCHTFYQLFDLGFEHRSHQCDCTATRDYVNRAWMGDEPTQPSAHPLDEHIVCRHFLFDQPVERTSRCATQSVANVACGHPGDCLHAMRDVRRRLAQTRSTTAAAVGIRQIHCCGAQPGTGECDRYFVHFSPPSLGATRSSRS
jgi:hypothetical protein